MTKSGRRTSHGTDGNSPFLRRVSIRQDRIRPDEHPFELPILAGLDLTFSTPVTFFVGENGTGKSSLLEAIAWSAGFASSGGAKDHRFAEAVDDGHALGRALALTWNRKVADGFFLRAETFFNFATYLTEVGSTFERYGSRPLHDQSHGEAFLALFYHRFERGFFVLDEPEAALSPQRQLAFLRILHMLAAPRNAQFLIATHSPMLLAFPGATILSLDGGRIAPIDYRDTEHYRVTKNFLDAPERYFRYLFDDSTPDPSDPDSAE